MLWLAMLISCVQPEPTAAATQAEAVSLVGKWEPVSAQERLCLLLTEQGEATLSLRGLGQQAKIEVTGTYTHTGSALTLLPARIHRDRYVSPCRKHVELPKDLPAQDVLGLTVAPGAPSTFTVRPVPPDRLEVCGLPASCALLERVSLPE